jgi:hypothetical protein
LATAQGQWINLACVPLYTHTHIHALISVIYLVLVSSLSYLLFSFVKSLLVGSTGVAECVPGF